MADPAELARDFSRDREELERRVDDIAEARQAVGGHRLPLERFREHLSSHCARCVTGLWPAVRPLGPGVRQLESGERAAFGTLERAVIGLEVDGDDQAQFGRLVVLLRSGLGRAFELEARMFLVLGVPAGGAGCGGEGDAARSGHASGWRTSNDLPGYYMTCLCASQDLVDRIGRAFHRRGRA